VLIASILLTMRLAAFSVQVEATALNATQKNQGGADRPSEDAQASALPRDKGIEWIATDRSQTPASGDAYILRSYGPDRQANTPDDKTLTVSLLKLRQMSGPANLPSPP
jgi:hypothetical protein